MFRFSKLLLLALVAAAVLGTPPSARANVTVFVSTDGGATYSFASSGTGIVHLDAAGSGFTLTVTGTSNQPNAGAAQSQISQISTTINSDGSPVALPNIIIALSDQNFAQVSGAATLSSSISGTSGILTG